MCVAVCGCVFHAEVLLALSVTFDCQTFKRWCCVSCRGGCVKQVCARACGCEHGAVAGKRCVHVLECVCVRGYDV